MSQDRPSQSDDENDHDEAEEDEESFDNAAIDGDGQPVSELISDDFGDGDSQKLGKKKVCCGFSLCPLLSCFISVV